MVMHVLRLTSTWFGDGLVLGGGGATCQHPTSYVCSCRCLSVPSQHVWMDGHIYGWVGGCVCGHVCAPMYRRVHGILAWVLLGYLFKRFPRGFQDMFQDEDAVKTAVLFRGRKDSCARILVARNTCRRSFDEPLLDSILDMVSS